MQQKHNKDKKDPKDIAKDGELIRRSFFMQDGKMMDQAIAEIVNDAAAAGLSEDEIKREVCVRRLGAAAVNGKSQVFVDAAFRVLSTPIDELARPPQQHREGPTPEQERQRAQQAVIDAARGAAAGARQLYIDTLTGGPRIDRSGSLEDAQKGAADAYRDYCDGLTKGWIN